MTEPNIPKNVVDNQELKVCSTCNVSFPATKEYFYWRSDNNKLRNQCKKCKTKTDRLWQQKNREHISTYCRKKRSENPEYYNAVCKRYRDRNPKKRYEICMKWKRDNPEKCKVIQRKSNKKTRSTPSGNLNHRMSVSIQRALKGNKKGRKWEDMIGYTLDDLKKHIEAQFVDGMTWALLLKGKIHIDHKIPKSVFNYKTSEDIDFHRCWALSNLQPLWAKDNLKKNDKLEAPFQPSFAFGGKLK